MTSPTPVKAMPDSRPETISGMAISLAFWVCLFVAAGIFGLVALSPKLLSYVTLRNQFDNNQLRLVMLERQAGQLQRVIDAISSDKDFASELTRVEFDAVRPGEEVIPVDPSLKLDGRIFQSQVSGPAFELPWYEPTVRLLANDVSLRKSFLAAAAILVVISFWVFQPAGPKQVSSGVRNDRLIWRSLRSRYVR